MRRALVGLGAAAAALVLAVPAEAGISYYAAGDSVNAGQQDSATISCALGQRALGGATTSQGFYNTSRVNSAGLADGPDAGSKDDDAWIGFVDGITGNMISAGIACVDGAPAAALKYRTEDANVGANQRKKVIASCPRGYKVTGGGVLNSGLFGQATVKSSRPVRKGTAWEAVVQSLGGATPTMTAQAVCARGGFAKELSYESVKRTTQPGEQKGAVAECDGSNNSKVVGGGVKVGKGAFLLNSVGILVDGTGARAFVDATGADPVKFTTYAVCFK